jgi:hypothetical protein
MSTPEGYLVERGTTQPVMKLFSEMIPVRVQNLQIRAQNPVPLALTEYEIVFSADAEFSPTDYMQITFPPEMSLSRNSTAFLLSRQLQAAQPRCRSLFNTSQKLGCSDQGNNTLRINGLFTSNNKQYAVRIANITNPVSSGSTSAMIIEVRNQANQTIASRSTLSRVTILEPIKN